MVFHANASLESPSQDPHFSRRTVWFSLLGLLLLDLAMFGDVLFVPHPRVLTLFSADVSSQFLFWRELGFRELRAGNLAFWNPYAYSGMPFMGSFQAALFYLPNWHHLFLPRVHAVNFEIALHVLLLGTFTWCWLRQFALHPLATFTPAVLMMFSGASFMHTYAGHLSAIAVMAWAPLVLYSAEKLLRRPSPHAILIGILALTMQMLAGHLFYMVGTIVVTILYIALRSLKTPAAGARAMLCFLPMVCFALGLSAIQLIPGLETARGESVRASGVTWQVAQSFAYPPENIWTLLAPGILNESKYNLYWGRWYNWEVTLFFSVTGLVLACLGLARGRRLRMRGIYALLAGGLFLLALGAYLPSYRFLYQYLPGFDSLRGICKSIFFVTLITMPLIAAGLDWLLSRTGSEKKLALACFIPTITMALLSAVFAWQSEPFTLTARILEAVRATQQTFLPQALYSHPEFFAAVSNSLADAFRLCAITFGTLTLLLAFTQRWPAARYAVAALAMLEIFCFARTNRPTFDEARLHLPQVEQFLAERPGEYRVLQTRNPSHSLLMRYNNITGYDPVAMRRYMELIAYTQGEDPDAGEYGSAFTRFPSLYAMLRCRYYLKHEGNSLQIIESPAEPLPHAILLEDYEVIDTGRDAILAALSSEDFDPRKKILLESRPNVEPQKGGASGTVSVIDESTDVLLVEAELPAPAILLITDTYAKDWRATSLEGSVQQDYTVMPGNYVLRAIPLQAGHHRFRIEYLPSAFLIGRNITLVFLFAYITFGFWAVINYRKNL